MNQVVLNRIRKGAREGGEREERERERGKRQRERERERVHHKFALCSFSDQAGLFYIHSSKAL